MTEGEFRGFGRGALAFLRGLARNNTREWFQAHRDDYEREVRAPLAALVEEMDVRFAALAPEIVGDPKRSLFRIHRDVRFSNDKSPYKTNVACWLYHMDAGRGVGGDAAHGGAGFYFDIGPDDITPLLWVVMGAAARSGCRPAPRWRAFASASTRSTSRSRRSCVPRR